MVQHFMHSLQMGDRTVIDRAKDAPPDFLAELERNWKTLDKNARDIAVLMLQRIDSVPGANFLLRVTGDPNVQVASSAARVLEGSKHLPSGDSILALLPSRESPFVRGKLYLAAGKANCGLEALRRTAANEAGAEAALHAQAAMVKRNGIPERLAFFDRVRNARPDEVLLCSDHLLYIGDPNLAKAMLPWLSSTDGVMRIGYDSGRNTDRQARMCDFAVWNGKELGLPTGAGTSIQIYDPVLISQVRKLYSELPDPKAMEE